MRKKKYIQPSASFFIVEDSPILEGSIKMKKITDHEEYIDGEDDVW